MMPRFRLDDPWRISWQAITSDYLLGGTLVALALALILAAWLPQMTDLGPDDAAWQAEMFRRFGGEGWSDTVRSWLHTVGAFHVTRSVGFHLLLALLAFCLLARFFDSVEGLWRGWRGRVLPEHASWMAVEEDWEELAAGLRRRRFRIAISDAPSEEAGGGGRAGIVLCADRWPWGELGPVLVYLGGLMALLGMVVTTLWGWRSGPFLVAAGESLDLGHGSYLAFQLDDLSQDGRRGVGKFWREGGALVGEGDLAMGQPLTGGGVGVYLVGSGAGLRVRANLSDTQILELATGPDEGGREELVLAFTKDEARQFVGVPEADLVLLLSMPQPVQMGVLPQVQVFESVSGQLILEQDASADANLTVEGVSFFLTPVSYAKVQIVHDPGAFWSQLGVIGLVFGAALWVLWPSRRLWLRRLAGAGEASSGVEALGDVDEFVTPVAPPDLEGEG
jgi:cytochrome c biogenesis protein ResB